MKVRVVGITASLSLAALAFACGGSERRSGFQTDVNAAEPDGGSNGFGQVEPSTKKVECGLNHDSSDPDTDYDGDGFPLKYDCNECNTAINVGAHDIPGNGIDEDCSGTADDEETSCDVDLELAGNDAMDAARAIGLCRRADKKGKSWGVIEANWVLPDGSSLPSHDGVGILTKLGVNAPPSGMSMLALSSGVARDPSDVDYDRIRKSYQSGTPTGYPKESPACPGIKSGPGRDGAALEVKIRVPSNAKALSFQQNFFTKEYPDFICKVYNDFYVALMDPPPEGLPDGNIAFDQDGNPISVNNSLLQVCQPGRHGNELANPPILKDFPCPLGTTTLRDTGFDEGDGAATGWLTTTAPVKAGEVITLRFAIWDSQDSFYDSTVVIDDFKWSTDDPGTTKTRPSDPK